MRVYIYIYRERERKILVCIELCVDGNLCMSINLGSCILLCMGRIYLYIYMHRNELRLYVYMYIYIYKVRPN